MVRCGGDRPEQALTFKPGETKSMWLDLAVPAGYRALGPLAFTTGSGVLLTQAVVLFDGRVQMVARNVSSSAVTQQNYWVDVLCAPA